MATILAFPHPSDRPAIDPSAFSQPHFALLLSRTRTIKAQATSPAQPAHPNGRENVLSIGEARRFEFSFRTTAAS